MMKKENLNPEIRIVEGNAKLTGSDSSAFLIFNIPAVVTCPYATALCKYVCYAKLEERYSNVRESRGSNFEASKKESFISDVVAHIEYHLNRKKYQGKHLYFRIHSSGDFYSLEYFDKWVKIADYFKDDNRITFQAYTKSLPYVSLYDLDEVNITFVYSVMEDTDPMYIRIAQELGMKLFRAVPEEEFKNASFHCNGECGKCTACYHKDNDINDISIVYHGARAKSVSKVTAQL